MKSSEKSYAGPELALSTEVTSAISSQYLRNVLDHAGKLGTVLAIKYNNEIHHNYWFQGTHNNSKHSGKQAAAGSPGSEGSFKV